MRFLLVCEKCGKKFTEQDNFINTNNDPDNFICDVCWKNINKLGGMKWKELIYITTYRHLDSLPYKKMTKDQRKKFKIQKKQLAFMKSHDTKINIP